MKSGAESDEVADMLVESLLNDGELVFGGVGKDDAKTKKRTSGSSRRRTCAAWAPFVDAEACDVGHHHGGWPRLSFDAAHRYSSQTDG